MQAAIKGGIVVGVKEQAEFKGTQVDTGKVTSGDAVRRARVPEEQLYGPDDHRRDKIS
jgi:hypothetical protein